ncbi:polysaccharide biosynthesis tyrosine autokinase [Marinilabilia rubra]|uniref:Capsular biosynthesis protein n=1 Tax=Marinilabilia rubra TaxID=2162893 RepID=A0A2U2B4V2_9BACT|nr:polysaccharide biosynthesis tyrosine autokinase [Marinilabilia rubra]PWD98083.1 hypothetical protein DDZ16_17220 [Marinilabilia rubra]
MHPKIDPDTNRKREAFVVRQILLKAVNYWPLFVISLFIALTAAYFLNKFSEPVYKVNTSLLVRDERASDISQQLVGISGISGFGQKTRNETAILQSYDLIRRAVMETNFELSFFKETRFYNREIKAPAGIVIHFDQEHVQPLNTLFEIKILNDSVYRIAGENENCSLYKYSPNQVAGQNMNFRLDTVFNAGQWLDTPELRFKINYKEPGVQPSSFSFRFNSLQSQISRWTHFYVAPREGTSVLNISVNTTVPEQGVEFLNSLIREFLNKGVSRKKEVAQRTIEFIDRQLLELKDSLRHSARNIQSERAEKGLLDVDYEFERLKTDLEELERSIAELEIENRYLLYLKEYLKEKGDFGNVIIPASLDIENAQLQDMLDELFNLNREMKEVKEVTLKATPFLKRKKEQLSKMKGSLKDAVNALLADNNLKKEELEKKSASLKERIWEMPENKEFFSQLEKNYQINDALYTMLLTRRSEMEILLASNLPANEVLEKPRTDRARLIAPRRTDNYQKAVMLGLAIPALLIGLFFYFNDRIQSDDQIEQISDFHISGHILNSRTHGNQVVKDHPNALVSESFRSLRTNIQFMNDQSGGGNDKVFVVTSGNLGEGKSFISLNLALSLAATSHRVALLSFDLRRPRIAEYVGSCLDRNGLSSYLAGKCELEEVFKPGPDANLYIGFAGAVPPNPPELMMRKGLVIKLFDYLRSNYDFIIVDTPPVGRVADALLLQNFADHWMFVVRHNQSRLRNTERLLNDLTKRGICNLSIVVNGIKHGNNIMGYGGAYSYGYGYGYGEK